MRLLPILSLASAGAMWGFTVPLSKLALHWFGPAMLATVRFTVMAVVLGLSGRRGLRRAMDWRVALAGVVGFGLVVVLQNVGIGHTSVTHAAVVIGTVPVLVALIGVRFGTTATRPVTWAGYGLALGGVSMVAGSGGGGASPAGDLLVLASCALSAVFIVAQPRLLAGRDAAAVTAVQSAAGALVAAPVGLATEGLPRLPLAAGPVLVLLALLVVGTLLPFWLFAYGQARVPAHLAGSYLNLEPVVGAVVGWLAFGDAAAVTQIGGAAIVIVGIVLSTLPGGAQTAVAPSGRQPAALRIPRRVAGPIARRAGLPMARRGWDRAHPRALAGRAAARSGGSPRRGRRTTGHTGAAPVPPVRVWF